MFIFIKKKLSPLLQTTLFMKVQIQGDKDFQVLSLSSRPSVLVWIINPSENGEKVLSSISLHFLSFFSTRTQTAGDDVVHLPRDSNVYFLTSRKY